MNNVFSPFQYSKRTNHALLTGFTLVELLVVVSIMALLLSAVGYFFTQARQKSRDATREQHIKTIQNGLAIYATARGSYPVFNGALTGTDLVSAGLKSADALPQMPLDPLNSGNYRYVYMSTDGFTYTLRYYLETDSIPGKSAGLNQVIP